MLSSRQTAAPPTRQGVAPRYGRLTLPGPLAALRRVFHEMNRWMVLLWRLGLGRFVDVWPGGFGRLMVIEHVGRRSGTTYRTPVNFTIVDGDIYCAAAFGKNTDWYRNALAQRSIAIWLPDGRWEATVDDVSNDPARLDRLRRVLIDSGFAAPLFGLHPRRMTDDGLTETTSDYRLLRIQKLRRTTKCGGYQDLVWVWPVGLALVVAWRLIRRILEPVE